MNDQPALHQERIPPPLFSLGNCNLTPGISKLLQQHSLPIYDYLCRHQCGDYGTISQEDSAKNQRAVQQGTQVLSVFLFKAKNATDKDIKIWVITNIEFCLTTVSLPEEF
jgi:hypothetical protein